MDEIRNNKNIYIESLNLIGKKTPFVIATVVETQGSTPQKPGSSAIVGENGLIAGTVGGGTVENAIQKKASEVIKTKESGYYRFSLDNDISMAEAAICGGEMSIILDASPEKHLTVFEALKKSCSNRIQGVLITLCDSDSTGQFNVKRLWVTQNDLPKITETLKADITQTVLQMLNKPIQSDFREIVIHTSPGYEDNDVFLESIVPLPRLIIAGAGHIGKALSHLGKLLDFDVTIWDDRSEFANKKNLPDTDNILSGDLEKSLGNIMADQNTYIVIVTRGHKNDSDVLRTFIGSSAGYIGMIGSRNKISQVREKFINEGWATPEQWAKVYTPIGLGIHSKTVQEIAVSIAAQLVLVRNTLNKTDG